MAPKKQNPPPPKPEEEVSEEEEEEEEEEDLEEEEEEQKQPEKFQLSSEESEEEEEEEVQTPINHQIRSSSQDVKKPSNQEDSESEEDDDDDESEELGLTNTETEYPHSPNASDFTVRPIASTPNGSRPTSKRALGLQKDDGKQSGIKKKAKTGGEDEEKGKTAASAGRIWSEEKEIAMLRGIIDYQKKKGPLSYADMGAFHEFVKGKLWDGVSKNQVADKFKRFKSKFYANVKKGENGEDPHFLKPHEKKVFDLCGQIWGDANVSNGIVNKEKVTSENGEARKVGNGSKESRNKTEDDEVKVKNSVKRKKESVSGRESMNVDEDGSKKRKKGGVSGSEEMNVDEDGRNKRKKGGVSGSDVMNVDEDGNEDGKEDLSKDHLKEEEEDDEEKDFLTKFPYLSKSLDAKMGSFKDKIYLIGSKKAKELDERWKKVRIGEMDLIAEELRLEAEQAKMVLDAMKSRGDC